jgi:uncharacterized protein (TIGR02611 family)
MGDPDIVRMTKRHGRRVVVTVIGAVVVLAGLAMSVLPGPGLLTIAAGLAILATEYDWAKRLLHRVRQAARTTYERARGLRRAGTPDPGPDRDAAA